MVKSKAADVEGDGVVRQIWLTAEQPCGKRLAPILRLWLPYYERRYGGLSSRQRQLRRHISPATVDRLLAPARAEYVRGRWRRPEWRIVNVSANNLSPLAGRRTLIGKCSPRMTARCCADTPRINLTRRLRRW